MKYVYLLYRYMPKHISYMMIIEGHYLEPIVCDTLKVAKHKKKEWKHTSYIRKVKLYEDNRK